MYLRLSLTTAFRKGMFWRFSDVQLFPLQTVSTSFCNLAWAFGFLARLYITKQSACED